MGSRVDIRSGFVGEPVSTPHVTAELLLDRSPVRPGEEFRLGLHLRMKKGWHT
jgi:DsbC/DsbD-like thiol-disulfide interchange protein